MSNQPTTHALWSSRLAFIMAASGSAIGLGNIWKFPYLAGDNGGGAFVLVYLLCAAAIGLPIMIAETLLGRMGRGSPIATMSNLAALTRSNPKWKVVGWMGVAAGFLILSYYSVIAGWAISYIFKINSALFQHIDAEGASRVFNDFKSSPEQLGVWHTIFMIATIFVVRRGVSEGLEKASQYLMPALFAMLLFLDLYAMGSGGFSQGFSFLFYPDFSKLTGTGVLIALGQAFFSLGLGMGAIMVYGAYLPQNVSIARAGFLVVTADTIVALMAGLAIFPLVFANDLAPGMGPGLIFETLPIAFGQMPLGWLVGMVFFVLVFFAAITSAVALIEPAVAFLSEQRHIDREKATFISAVVCWVLGLGTAFSFNIWSDLTVLGRNLYEWIDFLTADILLPVGGVLIAVFAGWILQRDQVEAELAMEHPKYFNAWWILVRYIAPAGVALVFLDAFGLL